MTATTEEFEPIATEEGGSSALRFAAAFVGGAILAGLLLLALFFGYDAAYAGHILPGVRVGSVDLGGLTPAEAKPRLEAAYAGLADGTLTLEGPTGSVAIPFADLGRRVDTDAVLAAALAAGRGGTPVEQAVSEWRLLLKGGLLPAGVAIDETALSAKLAALATAVRIEPVSAAVERTATGFATTLGSEGRQLDHEAMTAAVVAAVGALDAPSQITLPVVTRPIVPTVSTDQANAAAAGARRVASKLVLTIGDSKWTVDSTTVTSWIGFGTASDGTFGVLIDDAALGASLTTLAKKIDRPAADARFLQDRNGKVVGVQASRDGWLVDITASTGIVSAALTARAASEDAPASVELAATVTKPKVTTEEATAVAPQMVMISTWTTFYPIGLSNGNGANIEIPTRLIDGTIVAPGSTFDFWKVTGDPTYAGGYRQGGVIIGGHTQPTGALAGGICSCSTTLFNAALRAGLKMGARLNHYYYIQRYPRGLDATVFITGSSRQTMSWTNDTPNPILIRGFIKHVGLKGYVTFQLWSAPLGRKVELSDPVIKNYDPATTSTVQTTGLPVGVRVQNDHAAAGQDVWVTRTVRDEAGAIIHQETYYSHYARVEGVIYVGVPPGTPGASSVVP